MKHKYGKFSPEQVSWNLKKIRKKIFFLLLYVDPETKDEYENVNVNDAFKNLLHMLGGMNSLLLEPPQIIVVMSLLESALIEYNSPTFDFATYRKLILDAGGEILKIEEVD